MAFKEPILPSRYTFLSNILLQHSPPTFTPTFTTTNYPPPSTYEVTSFRAECHRPPLSPFHLHVTNINSKPVAPSRPSPARRAHVRTRQRAGQDPGRRRGAALRRREDTPRPVRVQAACQVPSRRRVSR
ncbi:unnamed protein product [Chondrus crispus]|uniref:Uncharacterized protein n=1 Tax=Chondrus crispus TaxID=2769 RepID=S0F2R4_CHOCR|nr:unnamed protein product [Chondrus crispus]CDF77391.1 unnamed protein product [Chondrus crispus]|eukprot:XP_005712265.1 unnamed protein product [Chondrus crispus]